LVVPGRSIEGVLARHALSLVINNEVDETQTLVTGLCDGYPLSRP